MSTMIAVPDELVEQVKAVAHPEALEQFFISAARKQVRQIRSRQLREEYARTEQRLSPRQVYTKMLAGVIAFETQYGLSSDQFLQDFETGILNEDPKDWVGFYRWRTLAHGLRRLEKEYGFTREAKAGFETVLARIRERFFG
ncbi:MAG: hypothetical protein KJZ86_02135 [Caldilineaceae bacterium]|nr:hypothetical protein [Caldilineaceae bacterium]HRJ40523.1 hypothetical protein [Caldilineaceae bacterium]